MQASNIGIQDGHRDTLWDFRGYKRTYCKQVNAVYAGLSDNEGYSKMTDSGFVWTVGTPKKW